MVYYVAYRASSEPEYMSSIAQQLSALGCRQIHATFWELDKEHVNRATYLLQSSLPVFLRRTRDVKKPCFTRDKACSELGSLVVVALSITEESKKARINSFLRKAPCVRLCGGVYAFSQRQARSERGRRLVDARSFWEFVGNGIDENAVMVPRLVIANSQVVERILMETKKRVEKEVNSIVNGYKVTFQKARVGEIAGQRAIKVSRRLRRRFVRVKAVSAFYEEWLRIDCSTVLMRPYPAIRKVRYLLEARQISAL